ncbi:epoxyqueuosine reductase [candidate division WOR-3 bacterium]|nr:epoxyqueuosine reductase [candidate division WOR-3 bacterium]
MDSNQIKKKARKLGANLVGIASVDRFSDAPEGFKPRGIYADAESVIVYAKRVPVTILSAQSAIPCTFVNNLMTTAVDNLSIQLSLWLEDNGIGTVMIPSDDPYEHWEPERSYGRAILSLRHAGLLAGLGFLGRNTLLINEKYGNMIQLGALLVNRELEPDPVIEGECPEDCRLCIENCPPHALDGKTVKQRLCRPLSNHINEKGYTIKKCNICRSICPLALGIR